MKPVQVMMDERLLARLAASPEVKRVGRSAVIRKAMSEYLRRQRADRVSEAYVQAYGESDGLDEEFEGWSNEGVWPEK